MTPRQRGWLLPPAAAALVAGVLIGRSSPSRIWFLVACLPALAAVILLKNRLRFLSCLVFSLVLGAFCGSVAFHPSLPAEGSYSVRGIVSGEISSGRFGQLRIPLSSITLDGRPLSGGAYWTFYTDQPPAELLPGAEVSFRADLYHPGGAQNPGGYDFREALLQRGMQVGLYGNENLAIRTPEHFSVIGSIAALRHRLSSSLVRVMGEESGAYASALLLGLQSLVPSEDRQAFSRLGIAHILSVSGFHVGILISFLTLLFRLLRMRQSVRLMLYTLILGFYACLCGMAQPVIRASVFLLLMIEGRILNRPRSGLHILSATLWGMVILSPVQVTSASFLLSFSAMFGLLWFSPVAVRLNPFRNRILKTVFHSFFLTFGIQLALLFPELLFFQRFPLLCFLINLPATLIASVLIVLDWLVLLLLPVPGLSALLAAPVSGLTGLLLKGIRFLGTVPGLSLWFPAPTIWTAAGVILLFAGAGAFYRLSAKFRAGLLAAGAAVVCVSLLPLPHAQTEYIQFSAGNADTAVLWDQDQVYAIDTGEADGTLSGYFRRHRLIPEAVILTHLHTDHAGGLQSLIDDEIPIRRLILPFGAEEQSIHPDILEILRELTSAGTEIVHVSRGDVLSLPSGDLSVLWPEARKTRPGQDANAYSLVCRITLNGISLLQAGDLTGAYEDYAAAPADILKAAHHGSPSSTAPSFLDQVSPSVILLSCRTRTRPQDFRLRCGGIPVYATSESGALTVRFEEDSFTIIPFRTYIPSEGEYP